MINDPILWITIGLVLRVILCYPWYVRVFNEDHPDLDPLAIKYGTDIMGVEDPSVLGLFGFREDTGE